MYAFWRGAKYFDFLIKKSADAKKPPKERISVSAGKLGLVASDTGFNILWNGVELTRGAGLNVAVNTLGLWTDSARADWKVLDKNPGMIKCEARLKELPLSQIWTITLEEGVIDWRVDINAMEWLHIDEFRVICIASPYYKTWFVNGRQDDFPCQTESWRDIYLTPDKAFLVGTRFPVEGQPLRDIAFSVAPGAFMPVIQNPPKNIQGHIVGLRLVNPEDKKDYDPGFYHVFSGKIRVFDDPSALDNEIEKIRLDSLQTTMAARSGNAPAKKDLKVLLANMPWRKAGMAGVRAGSRWPHIKDPSEGGYLPFPFFLAYAASLLRSRGIQASVMDAIADDMSEEAFIEKISALDFDFLVTETSIPSFYYDMELLKKISKKDIRLILCGPNSQIYDTSFLKDNPFIDFVMFGEYEFTLLELIESVSRGKDLFGVAGLIYNDNGNIRKNLPRSPFDINLLPWPMREGLPMQKYLDAPGEMMTPCAQIIASRGCPFMCKFCLWPQVVYQGHHYRARTVKDVIDEMEHLVRKEGFKSVYFDDDTFNVGKKRMLSFCDEIIQRGLDKTQWAIMARPDLMDEETLDNMKKAGLWAVKYGMESADQALVDNISKGMDLKKAERMIRYTQRLGIKTHLTFTFGLPGETRQTIDKTIKTAMELNPFSVQFSITTPFPGTQYYDELDKKGLIVSKDMSSYDGHYKSVIKLEGLSPRDLELAKERAIKEWTAHVQKRRGFAGNARKFLSFWMANGITAALGKAFKALKKPECKKESCDILLIQCPPWDIQMPPLGIAYISSFLEGQGSRSAVFDLNIKLFNASDKKTKDLWEQKSYDTWVQPSLSNRNWRRLKRETSRLILDKLRDTETGYIGLSVNFAGINFAGKLIKLIKKHRPDIKIIVGGWGCVNTHMRALYDNHLIEAFVIGEGEETLLEILRRGTQSLERAPVAGAVFPSMPQGAYRPRQVIMDLDRLPWPKFQGFRLNEYGLRMLPLFGSRGCVGSCSFCNDWPFSRPYRSRSARNIFEEIKYHVEYNRISDFHFKDLTCNGDMKVLEALADLIISSGLKIKWGSQAIPRKEMTYELLLKLKRSGCFNLIYGIESFSSSVLNNMKKMFDAKTAERVLQDTHRAGIEAFFNIIVGFPGETEDDFMATLDAIRRNRKYISRISAISVCLVNESSDMQLHPEKYGILLPKDHTLNPRGWLSVDGKNVYKVRKDRALKVLELVDQLGLEYVTKTV